MAKEEREQIECEAADKRAYDLIKVLKYIIKGAGFELNERVQVKDTKTGRVYRCMKYLQIRLIGGHGFHK